MLPQENFLVFWAAKGGPFIVFTFTRSFRNVRNDVNICGRPSKNQSYECLRKFSVRLKT